ncbi:response regulator [Cohnella nanjingensis]|uniref:Response regulator n=1 Tax=Cohnella nanjingensis TaxID=1387779 RepID=A0A7X0RUG3_9BACL|nr:response regulator [Cohnella nanjingensis]MBB6673768.1 response regulator [Cohnella nanjingensis]
MKVILVDDEPTMHLILRKMLAKLPGVQVAGAFTDTKSAAMFLRENDDIGLALVDISMPGESGMAFAAEVEASAMQVVFVTSHKEFALHAYELSVLDYLVKPVAQDRLQRAVNRAMANRRSLSQPPPASLSPDAGRIVVTALGDVSVSNGTGRVKWISRKCAELFAYLLMYRGKRIPRSRLIADIFGGMYQANAESYLNTTVYQLRKSLEPLGMRDVVRSENDGYALELQDPLVDCLAFERQAEQWLSSGADSVEQALQIERMYAGDLFGDKAYVWAVHETARYAELYASFVKRLAEALIASRDMTAALRLLLKLNERNPLDESVMRLLMTLREQTGDKKGLTALYTDYVRLLSRELGIRPSEELIHLYDALISRLADKK